MKLPLLAGTSPRKGYLRLLPFLLLISCDAVDTVEPETEYVPGPIVSMQVQVGSAWPWPSLFTIDQNGLVYSHLTRERDGRIIVEPEPHFPEDDTWVKARFFDSRGVERGLVGQELRVIPSDTSIVRFSQIDSVSGLLERRGDGFTGLTFELVQISDRRRVLGPTPVDAEVRLIWGVPPDP